MDKFKFDTCKLHMDDKCCVFAKNPDSGSRSDQDLFQNVSICFLGQFLPMSNVWILIQSQNPDPCCDQNLIDSFLDHPEGKVKFLVLGQHVPVRFGLEEGGFHFLTLQVSVHIHFVKFLISIPVNIPWLGRGDDKGVRTAHYMTTMKTKPVTRQKTLILLSFASTLYSTTTSAKLLLLILAN